MATALKKAPAKSAKRAAGAAKVGGSSGVNGKLPKKRVFFFGNGKADRGERKQAGHDETHERDAPRERGQLISCDAPLAA